MWLALGAFGLTILGGLVEMAAMGALTSRGTPGPSTLDKVQQWQPLLTSIGVLGIALAVAAVLLGHWARRTDGSTSKAGILVGYGYLLAVAATLAFGTIAQLSSHHP